MRSLAGTERFASSSRVARTMRCLAAVTATERPFRRTTRDPSTPNSSCDRVNRLRSLPTLTCSYPGPHRSTTGWTPRGLEPADFGDPQGGRAGFVGLGQVDLGGESPVVVLGRVVQNLPHPPQPRLLGDQQQRRAAGVRAHADLVVLLEVRLEG